MQFGSILTNIGKLYEFSPNDHFRIELETPEDISKTAKSPQGAKCDIRLSFFEGRQAIAKAKAYIELKYFKLNLKSSETITDNRFAVFMDLENLERYQDEKRDVTSSKPLCYEIVFAENSTYYSPKRKPKYESFDISEGKTNNPNALIVYGSKKVKLQKKYKFQWDQCADNQYWLKINV